MLPLGLEVSNVQILYCLAFIVLLNNVLMNIHLLICSKKYYVLSLPAEIP